MRALVKGQEFIDDPRNREEVVRITAKRMSQHEDDIRASLQRFHLQLDTSEVLASDIHLVAEFMKQAGRLKSEPSLPTWLYAEPLKSTKPAWAQFVGTWKP
jgi:hypothetical protein